MELETEENSHSKRSARQRSSFDGPAKQLTVFKYRSKPFNGTVPGTSAVRCLFLKNSPGDGLRILTRICLHSLLSFCP